MVFFGIAIFIRKKYYHLNKTEKCEEKNINLIHIYEYDWILKQDIVKSMILNKLGIIYNKNICTTNRNKRNQ
jgi:hypothetical protein